MILVFGDSLSAGYGLPQGRGWADLLQQRLDDKHLAYRVVNASVSGETTLGGRHRLPPALRQHRPGIVILALGANDGLRGQPIEAMRENLLAMVDASRAAGAQVLIVGMRVPPNYGPAYGRQFAAAFQQVALSRQVALVPFLLEGIAANRSLFQPDDLHPNEQAQATLLATVWSGLGPLLAQHPRQ